MSIVVVVSIACPNEAAAMKLGRRLVAQRLAACAQTNAITSTYIWAGEIETAEEHMLTLKTAESRLPALEAYVRANHPYEVPEIVATEAVWVSAAYEQWVFESVGVI